MIVMKDILEAQCLSSPDGRYWEPALPIPAMSWSLRLRDAWAVLKGEAHAIRQTTKADIPTLGIKENSND